MKSNIKTYSTLLFALMTAIFESARPQSALATTNAYFANVNGLYGGGADASSLNMGQSFTVTGTSLNVSALGVFDFGGDGLIASHLVSIFSVVSNVTTLVPGASVTVPSGTAAPLVNGYRYASLPSPVILGPGNYYVVAFQMNGYLNKSDPYSDNNSPANSNNGFNAIAGVTDNGSVLEFNPNQGPGFPAGGSIPLFSTNDFGSASFLYDAGLVATVTPSATNALTGQNVTLAATAAGQTPITYQWYFTSSPLAGQTNSTLTLSNIDSTYGGNYWVVVSNVYGGATSSVATVTLVYPPAINTEPQSTNISLHGSATLSVAASGTGPLEYQWWFGTNILADATNDTLSLTNFKTNEVGDYTVTVSNAYGQITSNPALVQMLPSLNVPFTGIVGLWGQPTILSVGATGTGALQYQWYFNGTAINGAMGSTLTFDSIQFTNGGLYSVVVSSSLGSVSNAAYQVVVNPANVSLGFYPGVTVTGTIGYNYTIQASTDLSNPNGWVDVTNITLQQTSEIWSDYSVPSSPSGNPKKFYRVVAPQ
jgi:hypothetical protein